MPTQWNVQGEYMETCSCDFLCPCLPGNMVAPATHEYCKVAMAFEIRSGRYGAVDLDGVRFVLFAQSKEVMGTGDWIGGLVVDASASDEQAAAVTTIASAEGGGPLGHMAPLFSDFRGVERHPIEFSRDGHRASAKIEGLLDHAVEGVPSRSAEGETLMIDNTGHPANKRLHLAKAIRNVISAFGIEWNRAENTNGHFAPFSWQGEAA